MTGIEAYANLRDFGRPVITTEDAALRLKASVSAATRALTRMERAGLLRKLRRGFWSLDPDLEPLSLPEYLTAPHPAYVSFYTALFRHGVISQIPQIIYVASSSPTRLIVTSVGTYSIHQLVPEMFAGFTTVPGTTIRLATPEKALVDTLYLACARSHVFGRLPEVELGPKFRVREARRWAAQVPATYRRTMVQSRLEALLETKKE